MTDVDDLDALSSRELHDRAVHRALHHFDIAFLWQLLREIPAGEAAAGHPEAAGADAAHLSALISDALEAGEGDVAESLRPLYLNYLRKHSSGQHQPSKPEAGQPG
ncbi:MAG: hypothetical protein ACLQDY_12180 [Streptosporangiaceae bacterium]